MTDPVLWPLGEHSPGKHLVLEGYLKAWIPIIGFSQRQMVFVDGFCGPGKYLGGEPGSPIIALRALRDHAAAKKIRAEAQFFFIDRDRRRVKHLEALVESEWPDRPAHVQVHYEVGRFDLTMNSVLNSIESAGRQLAPTLLMADPCGVSGTPMSLLARVLQYEKCEVYVSIMWEYINRFMETREYPPHLDELFGTPRWRECIDFADWRARRDFLFELYKQQLRLAGARYVVHFELYHGDRLKYAIFFATKNPKACDLMKQAIWKIDPFEGFAFRGARGNQLGLELGQPNFQRLATDFRQRFGIEEFVPVEALVEYCKSDETEFHSSHARKALALLRDREEIEVRASSKLAATRFHTGTLVKFLPESQAP